jgi:hypothetical protein
MNASSNFAESRLFMLVLVWMQALGLEVRKLPQQISSWQKTSARVCTLRCQCSSCGCFQATL